MRIQSIIPKLNNPSFKQYEVSPELETIEGHERYSVYVGDKKHLTCRNGGEIKILKDMPVLITTSGGFAFPDYSKIQGYISVPFSLDYIKKGYLNGDCNFAADVSDRIKDMNGRHKNQISHLDYELGLTKKKISQKETLYAESDDEDKQRFQKEFEGLDSQAADAKNILQNERQNIEFEKRKYDVLNNLDEIGRKKQSIIRKQHFLADKWENAKLSITHIENKIESYNKIRQETQEDLMNREKIYQSVSDEALKKRLENEINKKQGFIQHYNKNIEELRDSLQQEYNNRDESFSMLQKLDEEFVPIDEKLHQAFSKVEKFFTENNLK